MAFNAFNTVSKLASGSTTILPPTNVSMVLNSLTYSSISISFTDTVSQFTSYTLTCVPTTIDTPVIPTITIASITTSPVLISGLYSYCNYSISMITVFRSLTSLSSNSVNFFTPLGPPNPLLQTANTSNSISFSFIKPRLPSFITINNYDITAIPVDLASNITLTINPTPFTFTLSNTTSPVAIRTNMTYIVTMVTNITDNGTIVTSTNSTAVIAIVAYTVTTLPAPSGLSQISNTASSFTFNFSPPSGTIHCYTATLTDIITTKPHKVNIIPLSTTQMTLGINNLNSFNSVTYYIPDLSFNTGAIYNTYICANTSSGATLNSLDISGVTLVTLGINPDTGGSITTTTSGYNVYTFRTNTVTYNMSFNLPYSRKISYFVVGGGGHGGLMLSRTKNAQYTGGGGAGGVLSGISILPSGNNIGLTNIIVGSGSQNSVITINGTIITAIRGGDGGQLSQVNPVTIAGGSGGSGGGGCCISTVGALNGAGGAGTAGQGNNGAGGQYVTGTKSVNAGGGGGGAGGAGGTLGGGAGVKPLVFGIKDVYGGQYFGGGGGAAGFWSLSLSFSYSGGIGGGGDGVRNTGKGSDGASNTGGGGGGYGNNSGTAPASDTWSNGGSGIIIIAI